MKYNVENYTNAFIVGDAMGIPYEFVDRSILNRKPCTKMIGQGTHNQPMGTWGNATSLLSATMDGIKRNDVDYEKIMDNYVSFVKGKNFLCDKEIFPIDQIIKDAIYSYDCGEDIATCGKTSIYENSNGSLVRIAPLVFFLRKQFGDDFMNNPNTFGYIKGLSSLTHAHMQSIIACGFYVSLLNEVINHSEDGMGKMEIVTQASKKVFKNKDFGISDEIEMFELFKNILMLKNKKMSSVESSKYVVKTLECIAWLFLNSDTTTDAILKAVNMGNDTATIAALTGGLFNVYKKDDNIETLYQDVRNTTQIDDIVRKFRKRM